MIQRLMSFVLFGWLLVNLYGCIPILAGAAGGGGTAVWLSGKLTQTFDASYDNTIEASRQALQDLNLNVTKETRKDEVTQLRSEYTDGKEIWVDVHRVTEGSSKVEVRVGAVSPDKEAANKILDGIRTHLGISSVE
jgi:hypothetical protein